MARASKASLTRELRERLIGLSCIDKDIAIAIEQYGFPEARIRGRSFEVFLHTIVSQQISVHAAEAIWQRLKLRLGAEGAIEPLRLLRCRDTTLRKAGLSARKAEYAKLLAKAVVDGSFEPAKLSRLEDEQVIEKISAQKGFGRWSAEMYLMFSLQRPDVFAADDLALRVGLQQLKSLESKPTAVEARNIVEPWRPYRSAGSLLLWHCYSKSQEKNGGASKAK